MKPYQLSLPVTLREALDHAYAALSAAGLWYGHGTDNAWDEAVQLVLQAMGLPVDADDSLLDLPLGENEAKRVADWLQRRIDEQVPLPYLTGKAWFAGLEFDADERALVPRSPIAELILNDFQPWLGNIQPKKALDLCCGGGCIGLAMAAHMPQLEVDLADISPDALTLAAQNQGKHDLKARTRLVQSDLFDGLAGQRYDLIVSNPPYVDAADIASMPGEYHHEPPLGLGSGEDGLDITRRLLDQAAAHLNPDGLLVVEVGNSWPALELSFDRVPFTWIDFEQGGHGVFALRASELVENGQSAH